MGVLEGVKDLCSRLGGHVRDGVSGGSWRQPLGDGVTGGDWRSFQEAGCFASSLWETGGHCRVWGAL